MSFLLKRQYYCIFQNNCDKNRAQFASFVLDEPHGSGNTGTMKLHEKIKQVREELGLSIQDVYLKGRQVFGAKAMSYRTLQRIESGYIAKFSSVLKICCAMSVPLARVIKDTELEQRLLIRKNERLDEYTYNDKVHASVVSSPASSFLSLETLLEPGGRTAIEKAPPGRHEKWIYVVEGRLNCQINEELHELHASDSISFDGTMPHSLHNPGPRRCRCLVFETPKHF